MTEDVKSAETTEAITETAEGVSEDADTHTGGEDAEFSESKDTEGGRSDEEQAKEKRDVNAENAFRRREAERRARELEAAKVNAIIEAVGENPFTHEEIKDAEDVAEYLAMREIQKQGGDPLQDYAKHQKKRMREERRAADEKAKEAEWFRADREAFIQKHPDVKLEELIGDRRFADYADGKIGARPLADIYEGYMRFVKDTDKKANERAAQALANSKATPGALSGSQTPTSDFFTREQVKAMSDAEVSKNYDKIRESMKKWK